MTSTLTAVAISWSLTQQAQATDTTYIYTGNGGNIFTNPESLGYENDADVWTIYSYVEADWFGGSLATRNNVIRFVSDNEYLTMAGAAIGSGKSIGIDAGGMNLGGFTVDTGAMGFSYIAPANNAERNIFIQGVDSTDAESHARFLINEDFTFTNASTSSNAIARDFSLAASADVVIAANKTFFVNGNWSGGAGETMAISGGGTMQYTDTGVASATAAAFDWSVSGGSTLKLMGSNISSGTAVLGSGSVTLADGALEVGVADSTLTANMIVGDGGATLRGTNTTLTGTITYSNTDDSVLRLEGSFIAGALTLDAGIASDVDDGTYKILTRDNDTTTFDTDNLTIAGLDPRRYGEYTWQGNDLMLEIITSTASNLQWQGDGSGGDGTWSTDAASTAWLENTTPGAYVAGDLVTIGGLAGETGGTISLKGELSPASITVTGDADWTLQSLGTGADLGFLTGRTSLIKNGTGALTIAVGNDFIGGITLNEGSLLLNAAYASGESDIDMKNGRLEINNAAALGGDVLYTAGTLAYGAGVTTDISSKLQVNADTSTLVVDLGDNEITWATNLGKNLTLSNSAYDVANPDTAGSLTYNQTLNGLALDLGAGTTLKNNLAHGTAFSLTGAGSLELSVATGNTFIGALTGFTGSISTANLANVVVFTVHNDATTRFDLHTSTAAAATGNQNIVLGSTSENGNMLHVRNLSGNGNISSAYGSSSINRGLNVEMTMNNTYGGNFYNSGSADGRMGTISIGSAAGQPYTFTWTGMSVTGGAYSSLGPNAKLQVRGDTTMIFATSGAAGGQWRDEIELLADATLEIARTGPLGFLQNATGNEISGAGAVLVSGVATLAGANTHTGGTTVTGTLTVTHESALGTGSITVGATGSMTVNSTLTSTQVLTNEGSTTLNGRITLTQSIANDGTLILGADALLDLSTLTDTAIVTTADSTTYLFATGSGTLDFSAFADPTTGVLLASQITGVSTAGRAWTIQADGSLVATLVGTERLYTAGGTFDVNATSVYDNGTFETDDSIRVSLADATFDVTEAITTTGLTVDGVKLTITGAADSFTTPVIELTNGAGVQLDAFVFNADAYVVGDAATSVVLNMRDNTRLEEDFLADFDGALSITAGTLSTDDLSFASITVSDAGTLSLKAGVDIGNLIRVETGGTLALEEGQAGDLNGSLYMGDGATLDVEGAATATWVAGTSITGEGTLYKTGSGSVVLDKVVNHGGTLDIVEGSYGLGTAQTAGSALGFSRVILRENGTFVFNHSSNAGMQASTVEFQGGTFSLQDSDTGTLRIAAFEVNADSSFNSTNNANIEVSTLTGSGNLTFGGTIGEALNVKFTNMSLYSGVLNLADNANLRVQLETINASAGMTSTVSGGTVYGDAITKQGAGTLQIDSNLTTTGKLSILEGDVNITGVASLQAFEKLGTGTATLTQLNLVEDGILTMNYAGTLTITTTTLNTSAALSYTDNAGLITLSSAQLTGVEQLRLFLNEVDTTALASGINLGISKDYNKDLISVVGLASGFTLTAVGDYWHLSTSETIELPWDENWGLAVIGQAPSAITQKTDLGDVITALYSADAANPTEYMNVAEGTSSIRVTGGGGAAARLIGGLYNNSGNSGGAVANTNSWIEVAGGQWNLVIGANYANNWNGGTRMDFNGDTHIFMTAGTVDAIFGSIYRDGSNPVHTGDVYISVEGGTLRGSIFGGGSSVHQDAFTLNGDTNIFVYTPLSKNDSATWEGLAGTDSLDIVAGGSLHITATGSSSTHNGDTNITLDFSGYTGDAVTHLKQTLGGSRLGSSYSSTITGSTNITVVGHENVTFSSGVIGGHDQNGTATALIGGNTNVSISGSSDFTSWIMGSGYTGGGTNTVTGSTNVKLDVTDLSTFSQRITAASNHAGGTGNIGAGTNLSLTGGNYGYAVMGGYSQGGGTTTISGGTNVSINGVTITNASSEYSILGAGILSAGTATINGGTNLEVEDVTFNTEAAQRALVGGYAISGTGTATINGGAKTTLQKGTYASDIIGGSMITAGGTSTINGGVNLTINSGDYTNGFVMGAGTVFGADTASSTVTGTTEVWINGGSYENIIAGFGVSHTGDLTLSSEDIVLTYTHATTSQFLIGGHFIIGDSGTLALTTGDMEVSMNGGSSVGVFGGSRVAKAGVTVEQQDITVNLRGGTVGIVYAAGLVESDATVTTKSTYVSLRDAVTFVENSSVNGGYAFIGDGASNTTSLVTGDRTLVFSSSASSYANIAGVTFSDFSVIKVTAADSSVVLANSTLDTLGGTLEKTGAGSLQLATGASSGSISVSEGSLVLAGNSAADSFSLTVASGARVDMTAANTGINGDVTLHNGSVLAYDTLTAGAVLNADVAAATNSLSLTSGKAMLDISITGDTPRFITQVLFQGVTEAMLAGFTIEDLVDDGSVRGFDASSYFDVTGDISSLTGYSILLEDGDFVLTNALFSELTWGGGNGTWEEANEWTNVDGDPATFSEGYNSTFDSGTGRVTLGTDQITANMKITGLGVDYIFTGSQLEIEQTLRVLDRARVIFQNTVDLSSAQVEVDSSSTLTLDKATTMNSLLNTGFINMNNDLTINQGNSAGAATGYLSVTGNLILNGTADQVHSFGDLDVTGTTTSATSLVLGNNSTLNGGLKLTGDLTTSGNVTLNSITADSVLGDLNHATGTLIVRSDVRVEGAFSNTGTVRQGNNKLTLSEATTQGGNIEAGNLELAAGDNSFGVVKTIGVTGNTGTLSITAGSIIIGSLNGASLSITTGDDTATTVGKITNSLTNLTLSTGTLTINDDVTITGVLNNTRALDIGGKLTLDTTASVTAGGDVDADDADLKLSASFNSLDVTGTVTNAGTLGLAADSTIGTLTGGSLAISAGDVTITSVTNTLDALSNGAGTLKLSSDVTVNSFSNTGEIEMANNANITINDHAITQGGKILSGNVTVGVDINSTANFGVISTPFGKVVAHGSLSLTGNGEAESLSVGGALEIAADKDFSIKGNDDVTIGSLSGAGSLRADGTGTVSIKAASSGEDVSIIGGNLTLGGKLSLKGELSLAESQSSTIKADYTLNVADTILQADSIDTHSYGLNFLIAVNKLTDLGMSNGDEYVLTALTTGLAADSIVLINGVRLEDSDANSHFEISINAAGQVILTATVTGNTWMSSDDWDGSAGDWTQNSPSATVGAFFDGRGSSDVDLSAPQTAASVIVDAAATTYTFTGSELTTGSLSVNNGGLILENEVDIVAGLGALADSTGALTVGSKGSLELAGSSSVHALQSTIQSDATLTIGEAASLSVQGALSIADTSSVTNDGTLSVGDASDLAILQGSGRLEVQENAQVTIDTASQSILDVAAGAVVDIDTSLTLTDDLINLGSISAGAGSLVLQSTTTQGGSVEAGSLSLVGQGNVFGQVEADEIILSAALMDGAEALLTLDSLSAYSPGANVTLSVTQLDSSIADGVYNLIGNAGSATLSWADVSLDIAGQDSIETLIKTLGKDVLYSYDAKGGLSLTVQDSTNRTWFVSNNYATTPGMDPNGLSVIKPIHVNNSVGGKQLDFYGVLDTVDVVYVDEDFTLDMTEAGAPPVGDADGFVIRNLTGSEGKTLTILGEGSATTLATLDSDRITQAHGLSITDMTLQSRGSSADAMLSLQELSLSGSVLKVGSGTQMYASNMTVQDSSITVGGATRSTLSSLLSVGTVTLDSTSSVTVIDGGTYKVTEKATLETGASITAQAGGDVTIAQARLKDGSHVHSVVGGSITIDVATLEGSSYLNADYGAHFIVQHLTGGEDSTLKGNITVLGGSFTGSYEGSSGGSGNSLVTVKQGDLTSLLVDSNLDILGEVDSEIALTQSDTRQSLGSLRTAGASVALGDIASSITLLSSSDMKDGSTLSFTLNAIDLAAKMTAGTDASDALSVFGGANNLTMSDSQIVIGQTDSDTKVLNLGTTGDTTGRVIADFDLASSTNITVTMEGFAFAKYFTNARVENGQIVADFNLNAYESLTESNNGGAGLGLLGDALITLNPQKDGATGSHPDLADVLDSMDNYLSTGNAAAADKLASAVAGSSATALGSSLLASVDSALGNLHNRTTTMGRTPAPYAQETTYQAWISAEGNYNKLSNDGTASGHQYNSYGGSFGVDAQAGTNVDIGMAISALYGTVESSVSDIGSGELNTYNLTAYAKITGKSWNHSFVATLGFAEASLSRSVSFDTSSYETRGDTDGYGAGFMYELGYNVARDADSSIFWQPVFNVSLVHASLNGYTETGSDAALVVGDQTQTYASFGLGARMATEFGENIVNRKARLNLRALVKADAGDRSMSADVSFVDGSTTRSIEGAEASMFGVEFGAGLSVPVGMETGTFFMDAGLELRDGQNSMNASAGYRFSF